MPVYNERETFRTVFEELLAGSTADTEIEIVVVESNSTDGTREDVLALRDIPRVTVILENKPSGKGHAVRAGLRRASGDVILIQDADSEYDMADYEKLLEPLRSFESSFVLGSRSCNDGRWGLRRFQQKQHLGSLLNLGHVAFLTLFNATYGQRLSDPFTMYKVFRRDCLTDVQLECNRFDFDWELTAKLIRRGHVPRELPVRYHSRSFAEGKKITLLRDPMTWVRACFKYRFAPIYPVVYPANSVNLRDATPMSLEAVDLETRNPDSTQVTASEVAGAGRWSAHKSPLTSRNGARRLGRPFKNPVS
jgi:glycosyltransferase involved in cell wall biosynthesis